MKVYLGSDHAGFELKEKVKAYLSDLGHEVKDFGAISFDKNDDYPDFIIPVAEAVVGEDGARGIIFGKSGQGEAMAANRISGARAALYYGGRMELVKLSREHNDSNILSLAAGFINEEEARVAINLWLETKFSGDERHVRRLSKF